MDARPSDEIFLSDLSEVEYSGNREPSKASEIFRNVVTTLCIMTAATFLSFFFRYVDFHEANIIMAYILGVLFVAKQTEGHIFGIIASVIGVLTFNFFFTEPYYTFNVYRPDYPVTFVIMLIVAIVTSTLTSRVKRELKSASLREKRTQTLYKINKMLIKVRSISQVIEVGGRGIAKMVNRSVVIYSGISSDNLGEPYVYAFNNDERVVVLKSHNEKQVAIETIKSGKTMGAGTGLFSESAACYIPVKGQSGVLGVIGVSCFNSNILSPEQKSLLEAVASQIALAIERERLWEKQQKAKLDMERERLRGNLLRAISHDLRTPLAGILGATATILDNGELIDPKVTRELLQNVYEDAGWLIHAVENILSITRIDEGKMEIKKNLEAVEEIVAEAVSRVKKLAGAHSIKVKIPEELIMLPMDGMLIEQVLVNIIDNAIKYTPAGTTIEVQAKLEADMMIFEVSDNGNGVQQENMSVIFDRFFTSVVANGAGRQGTGLGLAICKSIIIAHGGEISAYNNASGGATFRFSLPVKEQVDG
jgi:two-component system sensor histidine kinase KdpD